MTTNPNRVEDRERHEKIQKAIKTDCSLTRVVSGANCVACGKHVYGFGTVCLMCLILDDEAMKK